MFNQNILEHIKAVLSADNPNRLIEQLLKVGQDYSLTGVVYSGTYHPEPLFAGEQNVRQWIDHYVKNDYFKVDPLFLSAKQSLVAQYWRANQKKAGYTSKQIKIYREIAEFGIAQGFDLSVYDADGEASMCFYFSSDEIELQQTVLQSALKLLSIYAHERIKQLNRSQQLQGSLALNNVKLTARERDCLCFTRDGYTYEEIAKKLNILLRTVTFHLHNAKRKLQAQTLPHGVAIAILNNII